MEKVSEKLHKFSTIIENLAALLDTDITLPEFYEEVMKQTGYELMLEMKPTEENKTRLENIRELKSSVQSYVQETEEPTLAGFLEEIALYTDLEKYNESDDAVVMMTIHSAKGLEFPNVFLVGMEEGLFPGMPAIGDQEEMEEERRLCYVAITRAKKTLTLSHARQRRLYGQQKAAMPSRFLKEIPEDLIVKKGGVAAYRAEHIPDKAAIHAAAAKRQAMFDQAKRSDLAGLYAPKKENTCIDVNKGDMVQHAAFGRGLVLSVMKMGGDALLEIAFDQTGTRKLMAKAATPHMKKLS